MNPLDNRYELNPALHRDMPQDLFEDQGEIPVTFFNYWGDSFPCVLHYEITKTDIVVDCSQVKDVWEENMRDDLIFDIEHKFGSFFLSRKDLNLNIIGI